ncbi:MULTISPECIES: type II toxin-antitoxin system VapC family toxin [unclassified Polynucleobacter]|uniref:type II toxin-antitoxin system VapC family toxin n=1 Tax=unclassified Polynucleobacter TaxID=2640945 RepID=UPI00203A8857|nr:MULTISPECIES: type II toxin-antitoxin system VapC family toxin [unclassified Polynucleobacter]MEA9602847.1 type II toxin-antitoxin system VapC family toxin [Polynucleobacter sp. JS-JIR-II-c23]
MLDTNTISSLIKKNPVVSRKIASVPMERLCLSVISEGEILYGLAKKPNARNLHLVVQEFLKRVDVLVWDTDVAEHYGVLRAQLESNGNLLGPLDMQIAAHASQLGAILVTNDQAFKRIQKLQVEDWTV